MYFKFNFTITAETKSENSSTAKPCNLFQSIFKLIKFLSKK